jgi:hypothetical protein
MGVLLEDVPVVVHSATDAADVSGTLPETRPP